MQKVLKNLILSVLFFGTLSACGETTIEKVPVIETRTVQVQRPAPIVPSVDQLRLRNVEWLVVTPENVDEIFQNVNSDEMVLFALTSNGYEALALNLSDLRANIQQQQQIIALYRESYEKP